jgi:hypothetical protein
MNYDEIERLRESHPAWSLLRSPNAALILSFLARVFIDPNVADLPAATVASELDDELYALNQRFGPDRFPRLATEYLDDWAAPERGWLHKFYPAGSDEAHYDVAPSVEKALLFMKDLRGREFVGTESRLNTIFELLRQMVFGAEDDPQRKLAELYRRRAEIDQEIAQAERGEFTRLDPVSQRDRYQQFARMARELLADFRQVEENFRGLDRSLREQIAGWTGTKGALLDDALGSRSSIADSDQGRSFQGFYDFLLSQRRQIELTDLLERLGAIEDIPDKDDRLARVHFDWIDASERTQATVRLLSEHLRRFLDDQVWLENRRVFDLLRSIESKALALRDQRDPDLDLEIDETSVTLGLALERPLHRRAGSIVLDSTAMSTGSEEFEASALLDQVHVDRVRMVREVWDALGPNDHVGLREVLAEAPLEQGLAELVGYLSLSEPGLGIIFDELVREQVAWRVDREEADREETEGTVERVAELPRVSFTRVRKEAG